MGEAGQGVDNAVQPHAVALIKEIFDEAVAELNP
jgi:hypothetical protein